MAESTYPAESESTTSARINRDSIKKGFEDFRHFASTNLTRAVQASQRHFIGRKHFYDLNEPTILILSTIECIQLHVLAQRFVEQLAVCWYVQYVTEKAGKADMVTEYGVEYETLCTQLDYIKASTEKMLLYVEAIAEPNPSKFLSQHAYSVNMSTYTVCMGLIRRLCIV